ncbi:Threonine/homoserine/homoserine lactone efflux protein [Cognatiyoonia sediminum]|uniref:Threonine/homoserine/homoserine lactone efflux protein n=1 Tax=Cognatiyoonia sediminum TaxID=1508389 RepID=A0A1M5LN78_9RHOB|nr:LysE family transporter [Cognatiyoonia sediminum]SHG66416.1 Threonine/homoserine/homoserine lactone efflux protein [Cognatiyoonia sediminum]
MTFALFLTIVGIHLAAAISPGPAFFVSIRMAATDGFQNAAALALGFGLGAAIWATAAMTGVAILFELVPALFTGLKLVGAAFLIFLALMMWRDASEPLQIASEDQPRKTKPIGAARLGLLTFLSNPKSAVFFGAVFIGLVPPETSFVWQAAIVAVIFFNETLWYLLVARLFSTARARHAYARAKSGIDRMFGFFLAGLGAKIALT